MTNLTYVYEPKQVDKIIPRKFDFIFSNDLNPVWIPNNPARSHFFNGMSVTMPYLEPYLVKSMKQAMKHITDPRLQEDIRDFCSQEAQHYRCHRKVNDLLKLNGHPKLAKVEAKLEKNYKKLLKRSLRTQLAYNAGFECMTNGITHWLIKERVNLFRNASPAMTSFWMMHVIEETEHKTVAYDVYMAYSGAYIPRFIGAFHGSFHVFSYALLAMLVALKEDKKLFRWGTLKEIGSAIKNVMPFLFRSLMPSHNPRCEEDPQWMKDWIAGYAQLPEGAPMPLLDTTDPIMPVPFTASIAFEKMNAELLELSVA